VFKMFQGMSAEVKGLSFVSFFVAVGFGVQSPALPVFANELNAGSTALGAMIAAFALTRMITAFPFGKLIGKWGERRTLSAGMVLLAITSIAAGLSQTGTQLIVFRGLSGVGSAAFSVSALSLLMRASEPESRGRTMGVFMGAMNLGFVAGPALGGALLFMPPRWIFLLYGVAVALTGVLAMRVMTKDHGGPSEKKAGGTPALTVPDAFRTGVFHVAVFTNMGLGWIVYGLRASVLPMMLLTQLHQGPKWIGVGLAICALLQVVILPYAGKLSDKWGRRSPLIVGEVLLAFSLILLWLSPTLVSYLLCMAVMGIGAALCTTAASAAVGDITGGGNGGPVVAIYQMAADFGMVIGPLAAGYLAEQASFTAALLASAAVAALGAVMAVFMPRVTKRDVPKTTAA
jgi:DHA1 family multidrug resistance protein-like MFS transporter